MAAFTLDPVPGGAAVPAVVKPGSVTRNGRVSSADLRITVIRWKVIMDTPFSVCLVDYTRTPPVMRQVARVLKNALHWVFFFNLNL